MFQETRAQHLRARNAADKGEESMTGMRFFANLIPEALKHRPRESRAASRFSREPHSLTISLSLSESTSREMEDRGQTKRERQTEKAYEKERKNESSSSTVGRGRKRERESARWRENDAYRFSRRLGAAEVTSHTGKTVICTVRVETTISQDFLSLSFHFLLVRVRCFDNDCTVFRDVSFFLFFTLTNCEFSVASISRSLATDLGLRSGGTV